MPITPRALVDLILLGPAGDRRQLQDSPVLGDVWLAFAAKPDKRMDLLIANVLLDRLRRKSRTRCENWVRPGTPRMKRW